MINKSEIRIGNMLSYVTNPDQKENKIVTVENITKQGINSIDDYEHSVFFDLLEFDALFGIPLTEDWLLKFGFTANILNGKILSYGNRKSLKSFVIDTNFKLLLPYTILIIKCVHQLQNLYFDLTGEELILKDENKEPDTL
jgi:hypothetical protein